MIEAQRLFMTQSCQTTFHHFIFFMIPLQKKIEFLDCIQEILWRIKKSQFICRIRILGGLPAGSLESFNLNSSVTSDYSRGWVQRCVVAGGAKPHFLALLLVYADYVRTRFCTCHVVFCCDVGLFVKSIYMYQINQCKQLSLLYP
jgi:hypothetical protein